jgi:hypothetical protein
MPYDRKTDADIFDRGRRCPGSSKTLSEAQRAADDPYRAARGVVPGTQQPRRGRMSRWNS